MSEMQHFVLSFPPKATRCRSIIPLWYFWSLVTICIKLCHLPNFSVLDIWVILVEFVGRHLEYPWWHQHSEHHDFLGSGWCQERQTHCPERSLLSPVSPEPHESLCYGSRWTDGRVCDGGGCVALIFLLKGGLMLPSFLWRPFSDRSPQKPWIEAKVHVEKKFPSPKFPAFSQDSGNDSSSLQPGVFEGEVLVEFLKGLFPSLWYLAW